MLLCNNAMYYGCKRDYSLISSPPLRRPGAQSLVFVLFPLLRYAPYFWMFSQ